MHSWSALSVKTVRMYKTWHSWGQISAELLDAVKNDYYKALLYSCLVLSGG